MERSHASKDSPLPPCARQPGEHVHAGPAGRCRITTGIADDGGCRTARESQIERRLTSGLTAPGAGNQPTVIERRISMWPVLRQLRRADVWGLGSSAQSERSHRLEPRTARAEHVVRSVCPYCAVGCGQRIFVENGRVS
ncbi:MAG: hypothetical protein ACXVY5_03985, partial [Gaiellales bacterium]